MKKAVFVLACLLLAAPCQARTITVDDDGPADFSSIQAAINDSNDGDTVLVQPGRYYENINFLGKAITVQSTNPDDPNIVEATVIDANGAGSVVTFANGEGRDSVLRGLTLTGGTGTWYDAYSLCGGGIYLNGGSPTISHNIIVGNKIEGHRGGGVCTVYTREGNPLLYKNKIMNNSAGSGGAIYMQGQTEFYNNVVCHNKAQHGGGLYISAGGVIVANNMIYANNATLPEGVAVAEAGGIRVWDCSPIITGNTIVGNSCVTGGGANLNIHFSDDVTVANNIIAGSPDKSGVYLYDSSVIFKYNNVWNNAGGNYEGIPDQTGLNGNISADPLFRDSGGNDYHLEVDSPCINAGDPEYVAEPDETDIDGEPRIMGARIDMGVDEYPGNISPVADAGPDQTMSDIPPLISLDGSGSYDLNGDVLTYRWQQLEGPVVDLTDANAIEPYFVPPELGIYVFELVVSDGVVESFPDVVGIVIGNQAPVADAGPDRYAGKEAIVLDGTGSYDPDGYGALTYQWQQISGPAAVISDANAGTPVVAFAQTSGIQRCGFELIVSDGDLTSLPDAVTVVIVPRWSPGINTLELTSPFFDPDKPTIVTFGGGYDCGHGAPMRFGLVLTWCEKANFLTFDDWYASNYADYANILITYLSSVAGDYKEPIQMMGYSAGGRPALDTAKYLNRTYADPRYAVNRVSLFDVACTDYPPKISAFLASRVDDEQCWVDNYYSAHGPDFPGALNVRFQTNPPPTHMVPRAWYEQSALPEIWAVDVYNHGVTAGAYISVIGPGKNLQLAPGTRRYYFKWIGEWDDWMYLFLPGYMDLHNESLYPGRLPEPVTLVGPADGDTADANGAVLSCEESENAVGYQLLFGPDPRNIHYIILDTDDPPSEAVTVFPFSEIWWTIKARDQYGTTVFADPIRIKADSSTYLAYLANHWLERASNTQGNLYRDQGLNFKDFAIFAKYWRRGE